MSGAASGASAANALDSNAGVAGARLTRLRIAGFKSFAEPVSLEILPGLTGIVGPNGCGKSNVVEALRWAMGETSARSLRGGEMDDVIFAGTTARASRNLAEVTITLEGALPAPFEAEAELAVTRRIERGAGSGFRANGREVRARDVQTLYADLASGARSSGMVSQGRVAALVGAKPEERRQVLEEAAGITGLHARRHEAELKLRAAEQNLARAEDLRVQLEGAQEGMRKQARQAARYRNISGLVRAAEAEHLAVVYAAAEAHCAACVEARLAAHEAAAGAAAEAAVAAEALEEAEAALPAPREALAEAARRLERRRIEAEGLAAEAERLARDAAEAETRLVELEADLAAAGRARADTSASVNRLASEVARLEGLLDTLPSQVLTAGAEARAASEAAGAAGLAADEAARAAIAGGLNAAQAQAEAARAASRAAELRTQAAEAARALTQAELALVASARLEAAASAVLEAEAALAGARARLDAAETARADAGMRHAAARAQAEREAAARGVAVQAHAEAASQAERLAKSVADATASLQALHAAMVPEDDARTVRARVASDAAAQAATEHRLADAEEAASGARAAAAASARLLADNVAARALLSAAWTDADARMTRLRAELATCEAALGAAEAECPAESALSESARVLAEALSAEAAGQAALTGLAQAARDSTAEHDMASRLAEAAAGALARLQGEADGLAASLRGDHGNMATALASIEVPAGLEAAIGAALGDASEASLTEAGSHRWRHLDGGWAPPRLPDGSVALASLVTAPAALAKALAHVALLDDAADGDALQAELSPGVVAVNRQGACWRWDGHLTMAGAPNAAAVRLRQRRRLAEARDAAAQAADAASVASARRQEAARVAAEDRANEAAARTALLDAGAAARQAEEAHGRLAARALHATRQRDALQPALERLRTDLQSAEAALAAAAAALERLADAAAVQAAAQAEERRAADAGAALDAARRHYQEARGALAQSEAASTQLTRQAAEIEARISAHMPALAELEAAHLAASAKLADATRDLAGLPEPGRLQALTDRSAEVAAAARAEEAEARSARAAAEAALDGARTEEAALRAAHREAESRLAAVADGARLAKAAADTADVALAEAERAVAALPDLAALQAEESASGVARDEARACAQAAATRLAELESALGQARVALDVARTELAAWQARQAEAEARGEALAAREKAARTAWRALAEAPGDVAARSARSAALLAEAEAGHAALQAKLTAAEQRVRALHGAQRDGEQNAARTREAVVRAEAVAEAAAGAVAAVLARAADRLGPDAQLPEAEAAGDAAEERARRKFERLSREREEMGPVNLRADLELAELDERVAALEREREELGTAIAKLRGAIGHLNREGRERLVAVFNQVDAHFRALFTRMMGGGRAHLAWSGSEDPLLAGLEIYAEPPGKKLSSLSLLSGGEQALTALSLIFAVFRCMPAPVCVLDEVDAPLDDANVERFCALLEDVVRETGTRFLVVTHHQVTMSRMDRLFGVTMQERGVSRLLSVDLRRAVAMVEPILQAAE